MAGSEFKGGGSAHKPEHFISSGARGDLIQMAAQAKCAGVWDGSPEARDAGLLRLGLRQPFPAGARTKNALVGRGGKRLG